MCIQNRVAGLALATAIAASSAQAASVKEVFEKHNLIGTFAWDCSKPPSRENIYYVHRVLDASRVQRDGMDGPSNRAFLVLIEQVTELGPSEFSLTGTRDGKPFASVYRVAPNRMLVVESTINGKVEVANGRFLNGQELPWANRCGA
jgi:hypothetical protein